MGANIKFTDNSDKFIEAIREQMQPALEACGLQAEGYAKLEIEKPKTHGDGDVRPNVDTSRLVNSISHTVDGDTAYIGTNVEYAAYVELGTSRSRPYPYLQPAVQDHKEEYKEIFLKYGN